MTTAEDGGTTKVPMTTSTLPPVLALLLIALAVCAFRAADAQAPQVQPSQGAQEAEEKNAVLVQYLEIVTPDVDATCDVLEKLHGVSFGKPEASLGNARTAPLKGGGRIGVRAPLRETEEPVVRPYVLVDDIQGAFETAVAAGTEAAHPPLEIPGQGTFAIYIQGGIHYGLWKN